MSVSDTGKGLPINNSNSHEPNSSKTSTPPDQEPNTFQFQSQLKNQEPQNGKNSPLTIELPSSIRQFNNGVEEDDEPTTPTSSDQKIPVTTTCPPAPRKPKTVPMGSNKRKTRSFQRISVDLRVMIDALFDPAGIVTVPDILTGDLGAGDHAKKANVTTTGS